MPPARNALDGPSATAPYRFVVAFRLLRARKINLIAILGVMVGVAAIIVVMAVMDGFQRELRDIIRGTLSDLIVEIHPDNVAEYRQMKAAVEAVPGVQAAALQKHTLGLVNVQTRDSSGGRRNFLYLEVVGILPGDERAISNLLAYMEPAPGQPEDPFQVETGGERIVMEETPRVVVSRWLAKRIGYAMFGTELMPGDVFQLITVKEVREEGRTRWANDDRDVVVSRIYDSHNSEHDQQHIYVDLAGTGGKLFGAGTEAVVELRMKLVDYALARRVVPAVARALTPYEPRLTEDPEEQIKTWEDRQRPLLSAVNNEKFILAFVLFFIVLVACFTIFATLTMTVVEKTREIGVLRALGATPAGILSIFVLNGTLVGLLGATLGYVAGLVVANNVNPIRGFLRDRFGWDIFPPDIYLFDYIPAYVDHGTALQFAVGAAASAMLFALIPALRAARLRPVSALRYE
ncbi:MAG: ABC transporter permease [Planctomycetaceae bacterium]